MSTWGQSNFGNPCAQCGFKWTITVDDAVALIGSAPDRFAELLDGALGIETTPELEWNAVGYVSHVADNLRIWAERFVAATSAQPLKIVDYDDVELSHARRYNELDLTGALWGIRQAAESWIQAWDLADRSLVLLHPTRGEITLSDAALTNAHDVEHHCYDVARCLTDGRSTPSA